MKKQKIGVVDVGGGYRGIYAAGVLDYCMDKNIQFDLGIGVSAGSANLISYAAGQRKRNYRFFSEYGLRKEYAGMGNFISKKSYLDLDYVYSTLSNSDGEYPLNYQAAAENPMEFYAVATDAETGEAMYFDKSYISQDDYSVMKASCAIPFVCHSYAVRGKQYFDGALADNVPIEKAFELGCDKVILLLTLPVDKVRKPFRDNTLAKLIRKQYPLAAEQMEKRTQQYNQRIEKARQLETEGKLLIVAPDHTCGVNTLCKNAKKMRKLYEKGYQDGIKIQGFLNSY